MTNDQIVEQVCHFNYFENDIGMIRIMLGKLGKSQTICEIINGIFRNKVRRDTKLKFYKIMAVPVPVSYTHLDVYKRQVFDMLLSI